MDVATSGTINKDLLYRAKALINAGIEQSSAVEKLIEIDRQKLENLRIT